MDEKNWIDLQKDIKNSENSLTFTKNQDIVKKIIVLQRILQKSKGDDSDAQT